MKTFFKKIFLVLSIPLLTLLVLEICLPATFFTFRGYEGLIFNTKTPHLGPFYPNSNVELMAQGDLCPNTKYAVFKKEKWIIDENGFRNSKVIKNPDIVFLGNSFIYGTGITQKDIISEKLYKKLNGKYSVYNMAPCTIGEFDYYLNKGIVKKPKLIIFPIGEINIPGILKVENVVKVGGLKNEIQKTFYTGLNKYIDKSLRFYSLKWIKTKLNSKGVLGIQSPVNRQMFFGQGKNAKVMNDDDLRKTVQIILDYKSYCDSLGIRFMFIQTPNKETIYFEQVALQLQPNFLIRLQKEMEKLNVSGVNTLSIFNNFKSKNRAMLYHFDDTHWNSIGIDLVSSAISREIEKGKSLKTSIR
jgi:hypothetical protein